MTRPGFIKQSGGDILIDSQSGQGTKITVTLPLSEVVPQVTSLNIGNRALVVEDDPKARRTVIQILEDMGIEPTEFEDPFDAIEALKANKFDLIISDLELGSTMDGLDVLQVGSETSPEAKMILMSGRQVIPEADSSHFMEKPVTKTKLLAVLEARSG